jgi:hypothetical protein
MRKKIIPNLLNQIIDDSASRFVKISLEDGRIFYTDLEGIYV